MELDVMQEGATAVLTARGELDVSCAYDLYRSGMAEAEAGHDRVVVDLSEVSFIDSVGLGMLVRLRQELPELDHPGHLLLQAPSQRVRSLLEITALADEFDYTAADSA